MSGDPCCRTYCKLNILLIGDCYVGKSSVMQRFTSQLFGGYVELGSRGTEITRMEIGNVTARITVFDVDRVLGHSLEPFYRVADGILLFYAIDDRRSFENLSVWLDDYYAHGSPHSVLTLIGSKSDLETKRQVSKNEGIIFARKHRLNFLEVSAKTGQDVEAAFRITVITIYAKLHERTNNFRRIKNEKLTLNSPKRAYTDSPSDLSREQWVTVFSDRWVDDTPLECDLR